ncbi:PRA1 family protein 3-like isoform X2 [Pseudochaenichthys georgianus]|uniref:PRA1 family protein 3-like isoform X2 n=1 Tax=Pseudochaenichthys georgianus TaxID=52239 RepID=UPI00146BE3C0|nr:PRA1 family protein 3-like isoform X2 [Pseudochaenichthys georgianus]
MGVLSGAISPPLHRQSDALSRCECCETAATTNNSFGPRRAPATSEGVDTDRCLHPERMFAAMALGSAIFLGPVWAAENQDFMGSLKRVNHVVFGIGLAVTSYILLCMLGSIMWFLSAISLPLALILAHASYRLCNMKNMMEYKKEAVGLKRSPMGHLLLAMGQHEEILMKIQNCLAEILND